MTEFINSSTILSSSISVLKILEIYSFGHFFSSSKELNLPRIECVSICLAKILFLIETKLLSICLIIVSYNSIFFWWSSTSSREMKIFWIKSSYCLIHLLVSKQSDITTLSYIHFEIGMLSIIRDTIFLHTFGWRSNVSVKKLIKHREYISSFVSDCTTKYLTFYLIIILS